MIVDMDPRRLELLLELSRRGSMHEVADALAVTTSTVSQQIAALARDVGIPLLEPDGRRVRLTPAGRRLAEHAVTVLAALEAARADLDPDAMPTGTVRVAAFATAVRRSVLPVVRSLQDTHPDLRLQVHEHEPPEALALLAADEVDLVLSYDYNLAPLTLDPGLRAVPIWDAAWSLGVRASAEPPGEPLAAPQELARFADSDWIVNSRNTADADAVRAVAALAGFVPRVAHRADSLDLVQDMVLAGLGVALLPADRQPSPGVALRPLTRPDVVLRASAVTRRGRERWPPLTLLLRLLAGRGPEPVDGLG